MHALLPVGYFPPISYFACLLKHHIVLEKKEHFVKQSIRSRCTVMGANGPLQLLVPRESTKQRVTMEEALIHDETDWKTLHWRSLESAYRNSPYFEYYEDALRPFFEAEHSHHFQTGTASIQLVCELLKVPFNLEYTEVYTADFQGLDLRNAWNKQEYSRQNPVVSYPSYIQVFSDRHPFAADLSIVDLLFCCGPRSVDYLEGLALQHESR